MPDSGFDGWDPQTEHYLDQNMNSYDRGAGARMPLHMQSAGLRKNEDCNGYVLWVRPLDSRHNENSLKNIFSYYGEVLDVRIIYPKNGGATQSPYGFVTFRSQGAATNAVRGINDNNKFEFKVSFSNSKSDRNSRNNNQGNNSRRPNRDRLQITDEHVFDSNSRKGPNSRTATSAPVSDFNSRDRAEYSKTTRDTVDGFNSCSKKSFTDQAIYNRPGENVTSRPRLPSTGSASTSSSSNVVNRTVSTETMETNVVSIKTEPSKKTSFIKPKQCCHCQKRTFNVCKECGQNFCHAECSLDGWRNHTKDDCVHVSEVVNSDLLKSKNPCVDDTVQSASSAHVSNSKHMSDRNSSFSNDSKPMYASDYSSPATEYREFPNLVRDYTSKGNKSFEDASPKVPKFEPVVDNNYDDNSPKNVSFGDSQQGQSSAYQQRTSRTHRQRDNRENASDHEHNSGKNFRYFDGKDSANENERAGYSKPLNNYDNTSSRNYKHSKDGGNNFERGSSDSNRGHERKSYDSGADSEKSGGGNRNYSQDSNRDRNGYSGSDRKINFNDRSNRPSNDDKIDNDVSPEGATQPSRGSYQSDRSGTADSSVDFETGGKSRGGYQKRNNAQNSISGISNHAENDGNFKGNNSLDRDSKTPISPPTEVKPFATNEILKVTIIYIKKNTGTCYVRLAENEAIFQTMVKCINDSESDLMPLDEYVQNAKCLALYKNVWHRGLLRIQPLRVFFIDIGLELEVDERSIRIVPVPFGDYRPFATQVMFPSVLREDLTQWYNENKLISIRATSYSQKERYYIADVIPFEQQLNEARKECDQEQRLPASVPRTPPTSVTPATVVKQTPKSTDSQFETLEKAKPVEVIVTFIENENKFFVAFTKPCIDMTQKIAAEDIKSLSPLLEIQEGSLALSQFLGDWFRVKIISKDTVKARVSFIDYGNVEECEIKTLKVLPAAYTNIPPLAVGVKLYRGTTENLKENEITKITPLKMENDSTWLVAIGDKSNEYGSIIQEIQSLSLTSSQTQPVKPKPRVTVDIFITFADSKRIAYGVYKSNGKALETVGSVSGPFHPISTPAPILNRIYVKQYDGLWCRARVTNINPINVYFIDYGNSEECTKDELFEIPEELQNNPPPLAVKMVLEKESKEILEYGRFVTVSWDQDNDTYLLKSDPTDGSATISSDTSVSIVNVVSALGDSNYAVILEENRNVYKYINREINANVDYLRKPKRININDLCLAIYEDENWHRAKIIKKSPLSVYFLDFADEMECSFDEIRDIPAHLVKIPPLALKIKTEDYVVLEEATEIKITRIEEIEHDYWKVATIKERDRSRTEIISDPKHIEKFIKKKAKTTMSSNSNTAPTLSQEVVVIDDDDNDSSSVKMEKEIVGKPKVQVNSKESAKEAPPRSQSLIKPFSESSLLLTRLSNVPKNYVKTVETLTNGMENLSLIEPKRNSTFYDMNVPIAGHLFDMLRDGDNCVLIIHDSLSDTEYSGMVICKRLEHIVDVLDQLENSFENAEPITAKKDDLVLAYMSGINYWLRAYVVAEPSNVDLFYQLMLFDIGIMFKSDRVYRLNDEFRDVPQTSVRISVTNFGPVPDDVTRLEVIPTNLALFEGDTYQHDKSIYNVKIKNKKGDCLEGKLTSKFRTEEISHQIELRKWRPTREEVGLKHVPVMNGDAVKISSICETNEIYITPTDDSIYEQRNDFLSSVHSFCKNGESVKGDLKVNEIIGVSYIDSYYRAQVIERKEDSYKARILDTGNVVKILKTDDFKWLSDSLKFADCYAICIQLHGVPCTDFNQSTDRFLKYIVTHEIQFILNINDTTHLVELICDEDIDFPEMNLGEKMNKGDKINDRLNIELTPVWKILEHDYGNKYYLSQMTFEEWVIGSELSLYFSECIDEDSALMINRYGETYSKIIRVNLTERLREYAETINESYVPSKGELCVAKYEGTWCRAFSFHTEPNKKILLQFLDIGYIKAIPHVDIRRMHADFLKHPAASMLCKIINYKDCKCLMDLTGKILKKCKVIEKCEEGEYLIEVENLKAYA